MAPKIRMAEERDAERILEIYAPVVLHSTVSFELEPPTPATMRQRIAETLEFWPWLAAEDGDGLLGYAYASSHRTRAAYQWSVDVSVYVHERARRCGVARALYGTMFEILRQQGFYSAYAGIALPNLASVRLHESMGFQPIGVYRSVGYKLGAWRDVGWWHLALRPAVGPPATLLSVQRLSGKFLAGGQAADAL